MMYLTLEHTETGERGMPAPVPAGEARTRFDRLSDFLAVPGQRIILRCHLADGTVLRTQFIDT